MFCKLNKFSAYQHGTDVICAWLCNVFRNMKNKSHGAATEFEEECFEK